MRAAGVRGFERLRQRPAAFVEHVAEGHQRAGVQAGPHEGLAQAAGAARDQDAAAVEADRILGA